MCGFNKSLCVPKRCGLFLKGLLRVVLCYQKFREVSKAYLKPTFEDSCKEIIVRNPKKVGFWGSRYLNLRVCEAWGCLQHLDMKPVEPDSTG